jgi:hypothetical protein
MAKHAVHALGAAGSGNSSMTTSDNFFTHYWRAFVWIALALFVLVILAITLFTSDQRTGIRPDMVQWLVMAGMVAFARFLINGGRLRRELQERNPVDNFVLNIVMWFIQLAILMVVWPFVELVSQGLFLRRARAAWERGEILTDQRSGRVLRSA